MADPHAAHPRASRSAARGRLTLDELTRLVDEGAIDTVLAAIPDMQGRLMGKRASAHHFLDEVARHGMEACAYQIARAHV